MDHIFVSVMWLTMFQAVSWSQNEYNIHWSLSLPVMNIKNEQGRNFYGWKHLRLWSFAAEPSSFWLLQKSTMLTIVWSCKDYSQVMWLGLLKGIYCSTYLKKKAPTFNATKSCYFLLHAWAMISYMAFIFSWTFQLLFFFALENLGTFVLSLVFWNFTSIHLRDESLFIYFA